MSTTLLADVANQVKTYWADTGLFMDQLLEDSLLPSLVNKSYDGVLEKEGDRVRVSQINRPTAQRKTVGSAGYDSFVTEKLSTSYVDVVADQVISVAFEFDNLLDLQSQIKSDSSKIRQAMIDAMGIELNNYLYSKIAPSASAPDHIVDGVTDFNATALGGVKKLASQAAWMRDEWYALLDPQYHLDFSNATTMTSADYGADDQPLIGGQFARKRFGFNILEDNSDGLISAMQRVDGSSTATEDAGVFFHPDFLILVMPQMIEFKVADLTANKQFGNVIVAKMVVGAALGVDGANKHILVYNT